MNIKKNIDNQGDISCSSLPAGLGGNGEFERNLRKIEEIREDIIQNEVSLGGSPTINVTLLTPLNIIKNINKYEYHEKYRHL